MAGALLILNVATRHLPALQKQPSALDVLRCLGGPLRLVRRTTMRFVIAEPRIECHGPAILSVGCTNQIGPHRKSGNPTYE